MYSCFWHTNGYVEPELSACLLIQVPGITLLSTQDKILICNSLCVLIWQLSLKFMKQNTLAANE